MPRVRRPSTVRLAAPVDEVRAAAIERLHAVPVTDAPPPAPSSLRLPAVDGSIAGVGALLDLEPDGAHSTRVTVRTEGRLDVPFFGWVFRPLVALSIRRTARYAIAALEAVFAGAPEPDRPKPVFGLPAAAFTAEQATLLASACAAVAVVAFAGALVAQLDGPIARTFGTSNEALGNALAVTRLGALLALGGVALADRRGRRRSILIGVAGSAVACAMAAASPNLPLFTATQVLQRAFLIVTATVAAVAVVEEAPEGARAYATSMLALAGGFGFSFSVITLPFADIAGWAWRLPFALGALTIVLVPRIARRLAETSRYEVLAGRLDIERGRVRDIRERGYARRFVLLAAVAFLLNVFNAPSSVFTNKYLTDVHHFSNSGIAVFRTVTTGLPGLFGILVGGRLAEARGRRPIAAFALTIATATQMVFFLGGGALIWVMSAASIVAAGAGGIALGTLDAELFPTEIRSTSNGLLGVIGVVGSALGLMLAGTLAHPKAELGRAVALCGIGALVAALALVPLLPESVTLDLDDVSPTETLRRREYGAGP